MRFIEQACLPPDIAVVPTHRNVSLRITTMGKQSFCAIQRKLHSGRQTSTKNCGNKISKLVGFPARNGAKWLSSIQILRLIWTIVCEEWVYVHIDRFPVDTTLSKIPELLPWRLRNQQQGVRRREYPETRQHCGGCPVAVIEKNVHFPTLTSSPLRAFKDNNTNSLYVNMMPVILRDERSLPKQLEKYWPLIEKSVRILDHRRADVAHQIGYLTIDERPVPSGASHRRSGLHVEAPGVMPLIQSTADPCDAQYRFRGADGNFVPGAEHSWGGGMMLRNECVDGVSLWPQILLEPRPCGTAALTMRTVILLVRTETLSTCAMQSASIFVPSSVP